MSKSVAVDERLFTSRTEELLSSSSSSSRKSAGRNVMSVSSANFATPDTTFANSVQRMDDFEDESLGSV